VDVWRHGGPPLAVALARDGGQRHDLVRLFQYTAVRRRVRLRQIRFWGQPAPDDRRAPDAVGWLSDLQRPGSESILCQVSALGGRYYGDYGLQLGDAAQQQHAEPERLDPGADRAVRQQLPHVG